MLCPALESFYTVEALDDSSVQLGLVDIVHGLSLPSSWPLNILTAASCPCCPAFPRLCSLLAGGLNAIVGYDGQVWPFDEARR